MSGIYFLTCFLLVVPSCLFVNAQKRSKPLCRGLSADMYTCDHCIGIDPSCAWCADEDFDTNNKFFRCDTLDSLQKNGCQNIHNPQTQFSILTDIPYRMNGNYDSDENPQIRPQSVKVYLRPKDSIDLQLQFTEAQHYPVDLYYVMDMSASMRDDQKSLVNLGETIAEHMRRVTKDFRIGFGSFVDKRIVPFIHGIDEKAERPCPECAPPYGFKHHMSLTMDTKGFAYAVAKSNISGNLDSPEGILDALVQALSCPIMGWRTRTRKMLILTTDAAFHLAGDGRLGGLVEPNDGLCHLDANGNDIHSNDQDYPTVGLVHRKIREHNANIIFAVTHKMQPLYYKLQRALTGSPVSVAELKNDSSNIVDVIMNEYRKIVGQIRMADNNPTNSPILLKYFSKCKTGRWTETNVCDGITRADNIVFNLTIKATRATKQEKFIITINPQGLPDKMVIEVEMLSKCNCTHTALPSHQTCSNQGDLACGVCICNRPSIGKHCECTSAKDTRAAMLDSQCRHKNDLNGNVCSGRGLCICGQCKCFARANPDELVSGRWCECDNYNCPSHNKRMCNGHGACVCNQCTCDLGWSGPSCECPETYNSCLASSGSVCNDKGICTCGVCHCIDPDYSGPMCETCHSCTNRCSLLKPCVMCQQFKSGPLNATACAEQCEFLNLIPVDELPENMTNRCQFIDTDHCTFYFAWLEDSELKNFTVFVKRRKDCPQPLPLLWIILGIIAAIVLMGLILLCCWKIFDDLAARAEYAKFKKDAAESMWNVNENPLYEAATSTFVNPKYQKMPYD